MLSGEIRDGGTIPLPHYRDGTEALESECSWIVSPTFYSTPVPTQWVRCRTTGRVVHVYACPNNCGRGADCDPPDPGCPIYRTTANYFIIATRNPTPTPLQRISLGELKVQYR